MSIINIKITRSHSYIISSMKYFIRVFAFQLNKTKSFNFYNSSQVRFSIDKESCSSCGICDFVCPTQSVKLVIDKPCIDIKQANPPAKIDIDLDTCIRCNYCVETCPTNAILSENIFSK